MKHLNPRQGITTRKEAERVGEVVDLLRVKHLNPRQGITTQGTPQGSAVAPPQSVKHLNPRQGITI